MTPRRRKTRQAGLWVIVIVMAFLAYGTISNQRKINAANEQLRQQAENGQRALTRTCSLLGVSKKIYADNLDRRVITAADYDLVFSTAQRACGQR